MRDFYGINLANRLMLGTAGYPSPAILVDAIRTSGVEVVTVSLRRESAGGAGQDFWSLIRETGVRVLPGAYLARDVDGRNPGQPYIRIAMVADEPELESGLEKLRDCIFDVRT